MSQALLPPAMTQDAFLDWVGRQDERYEFDGFAPVSMVRSPINHSIIAQNIWRSIDKQLDGMGCMAFIQDGGVVTKNSALRFPDVTVTCSPVDGRSRLIPSPVIVFEVASPSNVRHDKLFKLEEYRAVRSISTYIVLEQEGPGLTVFRRWEGDQWMARALTGDQVLHIETPSLTIAVSEIYRDVTFAA